mmetsp:Transcript_58189/g.150374  ORF Transcript_58189/g.150374 Transcript_58189/m.150374 type:complete len:216 (-) Transcript_58189:245-892(-)
MFRREQLASVQLQQRSTQHLLTRECQVHIGTDVEPTLLVVRKCFGSPRGLLHDHLDRGCLRHEGKVAETSPGHALRADGHCHDAAAVVVLRVNQIQQRQGDATCARWSPCLGSHDGLPHVFAVLSQGVDLVDEDITSAPLEGYGIFDGTQKGLPGRGAASPRGVCCSDLVLVHPRATKQHSHGAAERRLATSLQAPDQHHRQPEGQLRLGSDSLL